MAASTGARAHVAVVHRDAAMRDLLTDMLEVEGYGVSTLQPEQGSADMLRVLRPDLIFLDAFPDGLRPLRELREEPALRDAPVIVVSTGAELPDREAEALARLGGVLMVMLFDLEALLRVVTAALAARGRGT